MSKELVYIKDNIENTHYVYTNELNVNYSFIKCYEWLRSNYKTKYPEIVMDLRYTIEDDKCYIFCEEEIVNKGWVWNSKECKKRTLYELTLIPVCVTLEKTSVYIQTIEATKNFQETQTEFVEKENLQKTFLNKVYNQENNIDLFNYFDTGANEIITDFSNWYTNELEPVITNISKLKLGNEGYAPNPFSPINPKNPFLSYNTESITIESKNDTYQALTNELKGRLIQPNYGLRSKKYD
jgi:hypothetical protein